MTAVLALTQMQHCSNSAEVVNGVPAENFPIFTIHRYGKPAVLDMMEVDMYDACVTRFDEVLPGLFEMIINKEIMKEEK